MTQPQQWQNRIVGYGTKKADQFCANPDNPRRHPQAQRDAVKASLDTLGWIGVVVENVRSGYLIDGHERVMQALLNNDDVPYIQVDLSEDEEKLALASFDWITYMAQYDKDALDGLLRDVNTDNAVLQQLLSDLAVEQGIIPPEPTPAPEAQIDRAAELQAKWQVKRGDLWVIPSKSGKGEHRLLCGDSTNAEDVARLLDGIRDYVLFCDPFYGDDLIPMLEQVYSFANAVFLTGGHQMRDIVSRLDKFIEGVLLGCAAIPQMGQTAKPFYEHKVVIWTGRLKFGAGFSSVVEPADRAARLHGDVYHHTTKPVDAVVKLLQPFSQTVVVDAFAGAGSGFVAAERTGRLCLGMELEPEYCAAILERVSRTGLQPRRYSDEALPE